MLSVCQRVGKSCFPNILAYIVHNGKKKKCVLCSASHGKNFNLILVGHYKCDIYVQLFCVCMHACMFVCMSVCVCRGGGGGHSWV